MRKIILICLTVLSGFASTSFAHQQKEAYISLLFNERTGNMEVSHRFLLHDAEHGLGLLIADAGDLSTDKATQEKFFVYIQENFNVSSANDQEIELTALGYEVDGKYFWVYQEAEIPDTSAIKLKHSALHELWPSQTNHINIEKDGWVKSVRLQKRDNRRWHSISLDKED